MESSVGPEFSLAEVIEAIAATRPDAECLVFRDLRLTWSRRQRTHPSAGQLPARARASDATSSAAELAGPRERSGPPRASTSTTATSTSRAMLGALQGPGRAVQRQLPLRRRGAALPARRRRRRGHRVPLAVRPDARRGAARPARPRRAAPGRRRRPATSCCRAPSGTRTRSPRSSPDQPPVEPSPDDLYILYTGGTTGHAQGRAVAPGRHLRRGLSARSAGRARPRRRSSRPPATAAAALLPAPPFMHGAAHWIALQHVARRRHRSSSSRRPSASTRPTSGRSSSARRSTSC